MTCSITVQGIPLASASDDPNPTATCYFYDLTNDDGKTAAIVDVPIGTTMGVSPVTYPVGTQIRVEAVYTSDKTPFNAKVEHQQFVTTDLVVPLNFDGDDFPESVLAPAGSGDPLFGGWKEKRKNCFQLDFSFTDNKRNYKQRDVSYRKKIQFSPCKRRCLC